MNRTDDEAFRRFVAARSQALLRTAYLLTGNIADAEDLLQTALLKTYRHWPRLHNQQSPDAFVRRVMVTTRTDWARRRRVAEDTVADLPDHQPTTTRSATTATRCGWHWAPCHRG